MVVHDVFADEATDYAPHADVWSGGLERARDVDLWLTETGAALVVKRLPGRAAYPRRSGAARLFSLMPGQTGRYRANFRFRYTACACDPSWYYEDWLMHICHGDIKAGGFVQCEPDYDIDHRIHLYGGCGPR